MDSSCAADSPGRGRTRRWLLPGVGLLTAIAAVAGCTSSSGSANGSGATGTAGTGHAQLTPNSAASGLQAQFQSVVQAVLPSVVQISTHSSTGSGVVYDNKGDIVTNDHVVGSAKTVQVRVATTNSIISARVMGTFEPDDLAVIRVTSAASSLRPATFANSGQAKIGELVLAMGNPLGLTDSVTQGIVSATGRTVSASGAAGDGGTSLIAAAIQTSAPINPGNSGGALVDMKGQVLGIPTLAAREPNGGGAAPGIGFAIPSNTVKNIAGQLIATGHVAHSGRASLGMTAQTAANGQGEPAGVAVVSVAKGGPADKAGIRTGDVIIGIDGQATRSLSELEADLATYKPGQQVTVHVVRSGHRRQVTVTLGSLSG